MTVPEPQRPARTSVPRLIGRVLMWASILVVVLLLGGALLAALAVSGQADGPFLLGLAGFASTVRRWGLVVQTALVLALFLGWPRLIAAGLKRGTVQRHEYAALVAWRWRVLAFGVAYLLLVPIGPAALWNLFF